MLPGDLIFWKATYHDKKKKRQKNDCVHVEVFLGGENNENTIGSRWQKGQIKVFDTYKFVSKSYYDITYHYRSLDTWLNGICKSFSDIYAWDRGLKEDVDANKFSIFKIQEAEGASDDDEEQEPQTEDTTVYSGIYIGPGNNGELVKNYCM